MPAQIGHGNVVADPGGTDKFHPLFDHDRQTAVNHLLGELEIGNAVAEQSAGLSVGLVDGHQMAAFVEDVGGGESGRSAADHRHRLSGAETGRTRLNQSVGKRLLNRQILKLTDGNRPRLRPLVQAPLDKAGQTRLVNSGKLLVEPSSAHASAIRFSATARLISGIAFFNGQPIA